MRRPVGERDGDFANGFTGKKDCQVTGPASDILEVSSPFGCASMVDTYDP
jgi:hypothetical protein